MKTYFILNPRLRTIKIGKSKNPKQRLKAFQTGNSAKLRLLFSIDADIEQDLHYYFRQSNVGGEWFQSSKQIWSLIAFLSHPNREKDNLDFYSWRKLRQK